MHPLAIGQKEISPASQSIHKFCGQTKFKLLFLHRASTGPEKLPSNFSSQPSAFSRQPNPWTGGSTLTRAEVAGLHRAPKGPEILPSNFPWGHPLCGLGDGGWGDGGEFGTCGGSPTSSCVLRRPHLPMTSSTVLGFANRHGLGAAKTASLPNGINRTQMRLSRQCHDRRCSGPNFPAGTRHQCANGLDCPKRGGRGCTKLDIHSSYSFATRRQRRLGYFRVTSAGRLGRWEARKPTQEPEIASYCPSCSSITGRHRRLRNFLSTPSHDHPVDKIVVVESHRVAHGTPPESGFRVFPVAKTGFSAPLVDRLSLLAKRG
jgi:hypothetical protein